MPSLTDLPQAIMTRHLLLTLLLLPAVSLAHHLEITQIWIPEAPPVSKVHAAYMQITNNSDETTKLVSASSEGHRITEIHLSSEKDGVASMRRVNAITVPAGGEVGLTPGGYHLMLMQPERPLKAGDTVQLELGFDDGSKASIEARVRKTEAGAHHHHH